MCQSTTTAIIVHNKQPQTLGLPKTSRVFLLIHLKWLCFRLVSWVWSQASGWVHICSVEAQTEKVTAIWGMLSLLQYQESLEAKQNYASIFQSSTCITSANFLLAKGSQGSPTPVGCENILQSLQHTARSHCMGGSKELRTQAIKLYKEPLITAPKEQKHSNTQNTFQ